MKNEKLIFVIVFVVLAASCIAGSNDHQQKSRKSGPSSSGPSRVNKYGSSFIFPLHGNVYPIGYYFVQVYVGRPPKPYFLDPDTGSDRTWLRCNASLLQSDAPCRNCTGGFNPLYRPSKDLVACKDPRCASLLSGDYRCDNPEQCRYEVTYVDGSSSRGVLVNDSFTLNLASGAQTSHRLTIGCGYDQKPGEFDHHLDGVLGLGKGEESIVSQLHGQGVVKNACGHCLSRQGGFLFLGDHVYDSSPVTWTPMSTRWPTNYAAGSAELHFGGETIEGRDIIFDSGSTYTYFSSHIYKNLVESIKNELGGKLEEAKDDDTLPFCWKGEKPFESTRDVREYFKTLALSFPGTKSQSETKSQFEIPPEAYLIISSKGNACLGILDGTKEGLGNINLIGDISMQDKLLIYDNKKRKIGWTPANCDQHPQSRPSTI